MNAKTFFLSFSVALIFQARLWADSPAFQLQEAETPSGWNLQGGTTRPGQPWQSETGRDVTAQAEQALSLPVEAEFRFVLPAGRDRVIIDALPVGDDEKAPALLQVVVTRGAGNSVTFSSMADGRWLPNRLSSHAGIGYGGRNATYNWRFPSVQNLWDDRDRHEIGADFAALRPFEEKVFVLRLVLTADSRQVWLDDRLAGEDNGVLPVMAATPEQMLKYSENRVIDPRQTRFAIRFSGSAGILSADFRAPEATGVYLPLRLENWSHESGTVQSARRSANSRLGKLADGVPMWLHDDDPPLIDLGRSLFRYRLTYGAGPNVSYPQGISCWPGPFQVDPARPTFRVPYRHYQTAWLKVWVDAEAPHAVPRGNLLFYRQAAGFPVNHPFEISAEAIRKGLVRKLARQTPEAKQLYLVKVPLDSDGLYGMSDLAGAFLDFELTKPVELMRSYPDPIYYGYHAAGWPSSIRVTGITLEEAPFGFTVRAGQYGHVFERPEKPFYEVTVRNNTDRRLRGRIRLRTRSFDGEEQGGTISRIRISPRGQAVVKMDFDLRKLGWHEVFFEVEAGGSKRTLTQALVLLPPDTRTWGAARNETRFGQPDGGGPDLWAVWGPTTHYSPPLSREEQLPHANLMRRIGIRRQIVNHTPHRGADNSKLRNQDGSVNQEYLDGFLKEKYAAIADYHQPLQFYSAEWYISREAQHSAWPLYTGQGLRELTEDERGRVENHIRTFTMAGESLRRVYPHFQLGLNWGAPLGTIAYIRGGMPQHLVDWMGIDSPQFELMPEISNVNWGFGSELWQVRREMERLGWPDLPMDYCEGPFYPTNPGALNEITQAQYLARIILLAVANGVEKFSGVTGNQRGFSDAGSHYGAEHYGCGIFHRPPLYYPKPAVASFATMTSMLNRSDVVGPVDTGVPTTLCLELKRKNEATSIFALWRIRGVQEVTLRVRGANPVVIDSMGNSIATRTRDGRISFTISSLPVWLTGVTAIEDFQFADPRYEETPAKNVHSIPAMTEENWTFDGSSCERYENHHFGAFKTIDPDLKAGFGQGKKGQEVMITLPVQPGDRPLATRYGRLIPLEPVVIPGRADALGIWVRGNASWGRLVYQVRDARGEVWLSAGTKDDWNVDDPHAMGYVNFEGWRYVRFPLPSNHPWDMARNLEFTWWGSYDEEQGVSVPQDGTVRDGIVDLPLTLEAIFVEARNEVPVLGQMQPIPERGYALAGLVAEYATEACAGEEAVKDNDVRKALPEWKGPSENLIARLRDEGQGEAPEIEGFEEPDHFYDGRSMHIRFQAREGMTYNLYLSRYPDGRGAARLRADVKDNMRITGLRPGVDMYLFLTAVDAERKESKPSAAFKLKTVDQFGLK